MLLKGEHQMKKMFVLLLALSLTFMMVLPASAATSTENNIPSNPNAPVYRPEDLITKEPTSQMLPRWHNLKR